MNFGFSEKMNVELIYFNVQGRATQTRIMLKIAGIEFTDTRLTKAEFAEVVFRIIDQTLISDYHLLSKASITDCDSACDQLQDNSYLKTLKRKNLRSMSVPLAKYLFWKLMVKEWIL